jgi:hypothetical protein
MTKMNSSMRINPFLLALTLSCLTACGGSGGDSTQPPRDPSTPVIAPFTVVLTARGEIEPNDSLAMADAHTFPAHGANADYVGFGVSGFVDDTLDPSDYFLFVASRAHDFVFRLCPSLCTPFGGISNIDTSVAYFELLDQDGTLLLSSQGDTVAGNLQEFSIDAGISYYLVVFAEDTGGASQSYFVEVVEKSPFP